MRFVSILLVTLLGFPLAAQLRPAPLKPVSSFLSEEAFERLIISRTQPAYPQSAFENQIQGEVLLKVELTPAGTLQQIKVTKGPRELREAAMDAVKQWRFRPYLVGGEPTGVGGQVVVSFRINNSFRPHVSYR